MAAKLGDWVRAVPARITGCGDSCPPLEAVEGLFVRDFGDGTIGVYDMYAVKICYGPRDIVIIPDTTLDIRRLAFATKQRANTQWKIPPR